MLPQNNPDRIRIVFDDHRLVANAGLLLPATLDQRQPEEWTLRHGLWRPHSPGCACDTSASAYLTCSQRSGVPRP